MSDTSTVTLGHQGLSDADIARHMGWGPGTILTAGTGTNAYVIEITAVGRKNVLAELIDDTGADPKFWGPGRLERPWVLRAMDWTVVDLPAAQHRTDEVARAA